MKLFAVSVSQKNIDACLSFYGEAGSLSELTKIDSLKSSLYLNRKVKEIEKFFRQNVRIVSAKTFLKIKESKMIIKKSKSFAKTRDLIFIKSDFEDDLIEEYYKYHEVIYIFILGNSVNNLEILEKTRIEIKEILRKEKQREDEIKKSLLKYKEIIRNYSVSVKTIKFFDINKAISTANKLKINVAKTEKGIKLIFSDVILEDNSLFIKYNRIEIFVERLGEISRFILYFNNFTYDSEYGLNLILHPRLSVPFLFNNVLNWMAEGQYYKEFFETIKYTVCKYIEGGYNNLIVITQTIKKIESLWKGSDNNINKFNTSLMILDDVIKKEKEEKEVDFNPDDLPF